MIGCGAMGGAMLDRWLATGTDPGQLTVIRPSGAAVAPGVRVLTDVPDEAAPDVVLLAMKPHQLDDALRTGVAGSATLVVSILAGIRTAELRRHLPQARAVVRAMPNLPVALGRGVVALTGDTSGRSAVAALMAPLGLIEWIDDEARFDAVTALAGSGPAFVYRMIDALAAGGIALGLPDEQAARLALATVAGAGALAAGSELPPHALAERVASKGGSTRAGLDVLDAGGALERLVAATLAAAAARNRELAGG